MSPPTRVRAEEYATPARVRHPGRLHIFASHADVGRRPVVPFATSHLSRRSGLCLSQHVGADGVSPPAPRIIGGGPADFGEYPFMVALLLESREGTDFDKQYCGGSLIASRWVLTAAHCVDFLDGPEEVTVAVARTNLDSTEGQRIAVREFYIHPDWDPSIISPDVALLELAKPVKGVAPIQLAGPSDDSFEAAGTLLTVIGWGKTSTTGQASFPDELREVVVPVVDDATCDTAYHGFVTVETQVCAGMKGIDSCGGDSGGPLFATTSGGTEIQVGIVSYG